MTAILTQPQDKRERIPGLRDQIMGKVHKRLDWLVDHDKLDGNRRRPILDWIEGMDPTAFYERAPFSRVILDPPADKAMDTMFKFRNQLDREMDQKNINEWVNNLIRDASTELYPGKRPFWLEK